MVMRDPDAHTCMIKLPRWKGQILGEIFCRDCRAKLAAISESSADYYVLAELYDLENVQVYPVTAGAEYHIRDYTVTITQEEETEEFIVLVEGHA